MDGRTGGSNPSRDADAGRAARSGWASGEQSDPSRRDPDWASPRRATLPTPEEAHGLYGCEQVTPEDSSHTGSHAAVSLDGSEHAVPDLYTDGNSGTSHLSEPPLPVSLPGAAVERHAPIDRFEAFVKDNLGLYAPSFNTQAEGVRLPPYPGDSNGLLGLADLVDVGPIPRLAVDMTTRPTLDLERQVASLDSADMEYLRAKGAFDLPRRELQRELIEAHFAEVHPTAPVLNRQKFLSDFYSHQMPSRLLLFAVFTSGARACRNPELLDQKGTNHTTAQRFYKATKVCFHPPRPGPKPHLAS